jgi:hypothetical protein
MASPKGRESTPLSRISRRHARRSGSGVRWMMRSSSSALRASY